MVEYSAKMEPLAAQKILAEILKYCPVASFTTDRSLSMKKLFQ